MPELSKRFAVVSTSLSHDPRAAAKLAHDGGFAGLLFDAYSNQFSFPDLSSTGRREFLSVLRTNDVRLVGMRGDLGPKGLGPGADVDRLLDRIEGAMRVAVELNSPLVSIELGPLPEPPRELRPKPRITPEQAGSIILPARSVEPSPVEAPAQPTDPNAAAQSYAALVELGHRADHYSCTIAFSSALASFGAIEAALRAASCPWFGVDMDPVAMLRDAWPADEIFSRLGNLVRHVRVRDAMLGTDRRTKSTIVGQGIVDWPSLMHRLDESGYSGWMTVDPTDLPDRVAAALAARKVLS